MNEPASPRADRNDTDRAAVHQLLWFFALVYLVEGVGQIGGLIAQPLSFHLKFRTAPLASLKAPVLSGSRSNL